jgi:diadenosine tetraphosphate (Ap4A) HIT family hydrolase
VTDSHTQFTSGTEASSCSLCHEDGGTLVWRNAFFRVVAIDDAGYPGYVRVILNRHAAELSDLYETEQRMLMKLLVGIERCMREVIAPHKVNVASLGNYTPHQHWHIIPRWKDDPCFPDSIWSAPHTRPTTSQQEDRAAKARLFLQALPKVCAKASY